MAARPRASDSYLRDTVYPYADPRRGTRAPRKWHPHPDNPDWAYLSDELERDLVEAASHGEPLAPVLREYGIVPMSYYRWLWVGEGRLCRWSDGRPIQHDVRQRYWQLCVRLAEARLEHAAARLEQLRALGA
jgi:hypothetical protein